MTNKPSCKLKVMGTNSNSHNTYTKTKERHWQWSFNIKLLSECSKILVKALDGNAIKTDKFALEIQLMWHLLCQKKNDKKKSIIRY